MWNIYLVLYISIGRGFPNIGNVINEWNDLVIYANTRRWQTNMSNTNIRLGNVILMFEFMCYLNTSFKVTLFLFYDIFMRRIVWQLYTFLTNQPYLNPPQYLNTLKTIESNYHGYQLNFTCRIDFNRW